YLSRPFALTYEALSREQLEALQDSLDRDILWSGHFTRVSIDPTMEDNDTLGPYAAHIDTDRGVIKPVVSTTIRSYAADFIMGPNPGTRRSNVPVPGTNGAVTAHNGEMHVDVIDLTLPSRSLPITWRRVSSAQSLYDGPFGRGWDFPYNQRLVSLEGAVFPEGAKMPLVVTGGGEGKIASSNDVLFHDGRGHVVQFTYEGEEVPTEYASDPLLLELEWFDKAAAFYLPQPGVFEALVRFESGEFARLTREGRQYWYSSSGSLKTIYDRYPDNTLTFLYDARGRLSRIEDEAGQPGETYGRYLDVGYYVPSGDPLFRAGIDEVTSDMTEVGQIARIQDATGRDVLYEYTDGLLTRVEGIEITDAGPDGFTGRPITEYTWRTCEDGGASGQAIRAVIEDTGDGVPSFAASGVEGGSLERVSGGTGAFGAVALEFDHDNTAEALQGGAAETRVTLPSGSNTRMRFDDAGRISEATEGVGTEDERTTSYTYNDVGQVTSVTFGEGNSVHYTFDDENPNLRARANVLETTKEPGPRGGDVLTRTTSFDLRYNQPTG
ncbi:MAG: DUF6531 domain-containing protein, partial [Myxococcota bacterium]|nr:DUF6531 domain-containing protein [Myxococcota bacterium]